MAKFKKVYLLTGSNIEPRKWTLEKARQLISDRVGSISESSDIYESEPWGFECEVFFLNQVLIVETDKPAFDILQQILSIENQLGRVRSQNGYTARTIDIDILYYDNEVINNEKLIVPHPRLQERKFTLLPLTELSPNFIHPGFRKSNKELNQLSTDQSRVWKYEECNEV